MDGKRDKSNWFNYTCRYNNEWYLFFYLLLSEIICIPNFFIGDDCPSNVYRLCSKAAYPLSENLSKTLDIPVGSLKTGAVCVYPRYLVKPCKL